MLRNRAAIPAVLLASALFFTGCSKTINVSDLEITEDLKSIGQQETGQSVTDVSCPEQIDDPKDGTAFSCDLTLEDGSTVTANLTLEVQENGNFQATYQGIE